MKEVLIRCKENQVLASLGGQVPQINSAWA